jgi:hypothetical protein
MAVGLKHHHRRHGPLEAIKGVMMSSLRIAATTLRQAPYALDAKILRERPK